MRHIVFWRMKSLPLSLIYFLVFISLITSTGQQPRPRAHGPGQDAEQGRARLAVSVLSKGLREPLDDRRPMCQENAKPLEKHCSPAATCAVRYGELKLDNDELKKRIA